MNTAPKVLDNDILIDALDIFEDFHADLADEGVDEDWKDKKDLK